MVMRGVEKPGTTTMTSCFLGCFENKAEMRNELISLFGLERARLQHRDVPRSPNMSFPKGLLPQTPALYPLYPSDS